jgi:hypothetical protein
MADVFYNTLFLLLTGNLFLSVIRVGFVEKRKYYDRHYFSICKKYYVCMTISKAAQAKVLVPDKTRHTPIYINRSIPNDLSCLGERRQMHEEIFI